MISSSLENRNKQTPMLDAPVSEYLYFQWPCKPTYVLPVHKPKRLYGFCTWNDDGLRRLNSTPYLLVAVAQWLLHRTEKVLWSLLGSMAVIWFCLDLSWLISAVPGFFESGVAHLHREQFKRNQRDEVQHEPSPDKTPSKILVDRHRLIPSPVSPIRIHDEDITVYPRMQGLQVVIASCCKVSSNSERWSFWAALPIHRLPNVWLTGKRCENHPTSWHRSRSVQCKLNRFHRFQATASVTVVSLWICLQLSVVFKVRESHENALLPRFGKSKEKYHEVYYSILSINNTHIWPCHILTKIYTRHTQDTVKIHTRYTQHYILKIYLRYT